MASAFLSSFADDTRVGGEITCAEDVKSLQHDLDSVYKWTQQNNMELHGNKFELLRYGYDHEIRTSTSYTSNLGTIITEKEHVRDLGVTMDCRDFKNQISNVIEEGKKMSGWILRTSPPENLSPC